MSGLEAKDVLRRHAEALERRAHWQEHWRFSTRAGPIRFASRPR
jgi:hypothetical protein